MDSPFSRVVDASLRARSLIGLVCLFVLVAVGCDTTVPTPSNKYAYSLYGVLDPARDTQWVRVEPLNTPTSEGAPKSLDATVTLENLDTGQAWRLRDSLMVVQTEPHHNFWTTAPIRPGTSYRLTARRPDGATTQAETATPSQPPNITYPNPDTEGFSVFVEESGELAGLLVRYFAFGRARDVSYYDRLTRTDRGYSVGINPAWDLEKLGLPSVDSAKVIAGTGGPDWPEWGRYYDATVGEIAQPDTFSNVEGGFGMVAGVYTETKSFP